MLSVKTFFQVIKTEEAVIWYFESSAEVVSGYEQLYRRYTTPPVSMMVCAPGDIDIAGLGSVQFRMVSYIGVSSR